MSKKFTTRFMSICLALMLFAIAPAYAGFGGSATPDFPSVVTVGDTNVPVGLDLLPRITGTDTGPVTLVGITLIPSCGAQTGSGTCSADNADPGVFLVSATGTGADHCIGISFTINVTDVLTGEVTFTPSSTITLDDAQNCRINFTVDVLKVPGKDANAAAGLQTAQEAKFILLKTTPVGSGTGSDLTQVLGCGDSIIQSGETCDPPGSTPATPAGNTNVCRSNCTYCGDGIVNNGEQCDDGNSINGDGCSNTCQTELCDVQVDKQISCDGGTTWVDTGLVSANDDGTVSCNGIVGNNILVRYQAKNAGAQNVFNCSISESNRLFGASAAIGNLSAGATSAFVSAANTPICSEAVVNEPNTATLTCDCGSSGSDIKDTAYDTATFACRDLPSVKITKSCDDAEQLCTDEAIIFTVRVTNTGPNTLSSCTVTDPDCTPAPPAITNLAPGAHVEYTCSMPAVQNEPTNNFASVSCTDTFGQTATDSVTSNECTIPPCQVETCRTPGFWATHAGTEKPGSKNITQMVINEADGCMEICGEVIDNTILNSADSAVEAMCVRVQGNSRLQLVRQLTAAALNCVVSGGGDTCDGISIEEVFKACNADCATNNFAPYSLSECIARLDCFNNGGDWVDGKCWKGICRETPLQYCNTNSECPGNTVGQPPTNPCIPIPGNCHDRVLGVCADNSICTEDNTTLVDGKYLCVSDGSVCKPGPAGSSMKCSAANASACTVIQPGEASCRTNVNDVKSSTQEYCL